MTTSHERHKSNDRSTAANRIVLVGGGFACVTLAQRLEGLASAGGEDRALVSRAQPNRHLSSNQPRSKGHGDITATDFGSRNRYRNHLEINISKWLLLTEFHLLASLHRRRP